MKQECLPRANKVAKKTTVQDFKNFWSALKSSEFVESQKETDVVKWTFNDGTVLEVKQEEHSVSPSLRALEYPTSSSRGVLC